ncbi:MAG: (d)CMP kinase [Micrococcales bacterium]
MSQIIIAIDGPAGSGKSSVAKELAREFGFAYLDTGAAYRALAWAVLNGLSTEALDSPDLAAKFRYDVSTDADDFWVHVGESDVTEAIRTNLISESVSTVAGNQNVRSYMKKLTQEIAADCHAPGIIVEGRDITTVVFPNADSRILLTASEEVRIQRRAKQLDEGAGHDLTKSVSQRDRSDSKVVDFMTAADGVTLIDSTNLDFDDTVEALELQIRKDLETL